MKFKLVVLMSAFALNSHASECFSDENYPMLCQRPIERPNRIYFGPELLGLQIDANVNRAQIEGNLFFWGVRLGYEYVKPQAFYAALELFSTTASGKAFTVTNNGVLVDGGGSAGFGIIQTRLGYTILGNGYLVSPFLGLGVINLTKRHHNGFKEAWGVVSGGARAQFQCNSICVIGLNAELLWTYWNKESVRVMGEKLIDHHKGVGCSIGVPLTIRLSPGWDVQVTPYYTRFLFSQNANLYGGSILFGYRF